MRKRKIALRPSDQSWWTNESKNAPVVGKPTFRGTKGGSKLKGLSYYPEDPLKTSGFRRGTHEVIVKGRKLPGTLTIGDRKIIPLKSANPNRLRKADRENIVWAHAGTPREEEVRRFYSQGTGRVAKDIIQMFDDPEEIARIRKRKGEASAEHKAFTRQVMRDFSTVRSGSSGR
jgi:hypothetical protein